MIQHLSSEIETYKWLEARDDPVFARVVPRMIYGWNRKSCSIYSDLILLLTEYVGEGLVRDRDGVLIFFLLDVFIS